MTTTRIAIPKDQNQRTIHRAMGLPIPKDDILLGSSSKYVDIYDLSAANFRPRAFTGIAIVNPSSASKLFIAMGAEFNENKVITVFPQQFFSLDQQTFGPAVQDDSLGTVVTHIRARIELSEGTPAAATIGYGVSGNPTDQMTLNINGKIYEFSTDESKSPANHVMVPIGASDDITWTNFRNKVNANEQAVTASIDTGLDVVTITSNYGGAYGNGLVVLDGGSPTGAVFSGNLSGGSGGMNPIFHIW